MTPSNKSNRSDYGALDGWYGYRHYDHRFIYVVIGNLTAAYDGEQLYVRIGHAVRREAA